MTTFRDKEYKAKNHFLLNGIEGETDININRAGSYNIKTNSDVIFTSISYSKSWKIRGNQNKLTLKNNNGLLEINILDKDFKNFELYYDNTIIKLSIYLFIILSILSYISLSLIILKINLEKQFLNYLMMKNQLNLFELYKFILEIIKEIKVKK